MMIGPAPRMRMDLMSVRLAIFLVLLSLGHERDESVKQIRNVMRARRCFRVPLERKRGLVSAGQALQRPVKQADVRGAKLGGKACPVNRKTVVLAGNADAQI